MPRKAVLLKSLSRGRIRTSFNKYNLFNLYKKGNVDFRSKTLYQQKWTAKQETRAYHGEHLTEGRWQTFFTPKLHSVAQLDASLRGGEMQPTPILIQTFAVLEKRLDFALFRAMFASSVRQARQFILHGNVRVNGVKITQPGYTLKAGDVFNVNPEKVLQALGAKKPGFQEALKVDRVQVAVWNKYVKEAKSSPRQMWEKKQDKLRSLEDSSPKKQEYLEFLQNYNATLTSRMEKEIKNCTKESVVTKLIQAGTSASDPDSPLAEDFQPQFYGDSVLGKMALRCYQDLLKSGQLPVRDIKGKKQAEVEKIARSLLNPTEESQKSLSDGAKKSLRAAKNTVSELLASQDDYVRKLYESKRASEQTLSIPFDSKWASRLSTLAPLNLKELGEDENKARNAIHLPWQKGVFGRQDPSRSYFTPWKPRPFLAPFAILPHHLEISFKTCHAVYLRDPVARPGHSEVISPFGMPTHERAYMYYVRRGK
ncbi:LAMI_0B01376g1_1 [Lachancea mirantina]|uniref:Small ribosomal subunit protein uS4m n=1 Tax=Lachancea mirantina TaxID=1230905 RepID=A0A1G4ITF4_9SACH|nr:LAMI_0B01376g1_1 [Lachancea mirantina]